MKFTGYVHMDGRFSDKHSPTASTFLVRRGRPTVEGTLGKYYNFKVQPDFGQGKVTLADTYLELSYFGDLWTTRLGKFKVPQSLEYLNGVSDLPFVEYSLAVNLMPQYDVGVVAYGKPFGGILEYSFGIWNGDNRTEWSDKGKDSDTDNNDGKDFGGRLQVSPFRGSNIPWLNQIQHGGWFNYGRQADAYPLGKGKSVLAYRTQLGMDFFKTYSGTTGTNPGADIYAVRQDGKRLRAGWDAAWLFGSIKFIAEYDVMNAKLARQTDRGINNVPIFKHTNIPTTAWYVQASWLLTGEEATMKTVNPKKNFDPRKGGWGAFEIAARYSRLEISDKMFRVHAGDLTPRYAADGTADGAQDITLGLNWYLNPYVKLMFDWTHTVFNTPISVNPTSGIGSKQPLDDENAFLFRTQIVW